MEKLSGAPPYGRFLALLTNIRLGLPGINNNYAFFKKKVIKDVVKLYWNFDYKVIENGKFE